VISLRRTARSILIVGASHLTVTVATFAFTVLQARYLDPSRFGQLSLALAYAAFLLIFVDFGTSTLVSRTVAQRREEQRGVVAVTLLIRSVLWIVALPFLMLASAVLGYDADLVRAILVLAVATLFVSWGGAIAAYLQGREEFLYPSLSQVAYRVVAAVVGVAILMLVPTPSLLLIACAFLIGAMASAGVLFDALRRHTEFTWSLEPRRAPALLRSALPIGAYLVIGTFYFNVDLVLLEGMAPAENVGWYAAAYRLFNAATIVEAIVVARVLYPVFSRMSLGPQAELRLVIAKALSFLAILGGAVVLLFVLCADHIVGILYTAEAYAPAANALRLLAPGLFFLYLNSVVCNALFALGYEKRLLKMAAAFAVLNVSANLIAIPLFAQDGAAAVTTLTELGLLAWLTAIAPRDLLTGESVRTVAKAALAAAIAGVVVVLSGARTLETVALLAMLTYGCAILGLGVIRPADLRAIAALFGLASGNPTDGDASSAKSPDGIGAVGVTRLRVVEDGARGRVPDLDPQPVRDVRSEPIAVDRG
jgi:O-antigen/teichoic acid export membrane protein